MVTFLRFCQTKVDTALQSLPEKPRGGTWAKLKSTIRLKLFGRSGGKTVFHLLPLEETLRGDLEKVHFIVGYGILRPKLRYVSKQRPTVSVRMCTIDRL